MSDIQNLLDLYNKLLEQEQQEEEKLKNINSNNIIEESKRKENCFNQQMPADNNQILNQQNFDQLQQQFKALSLNYEDLNQNGNNQDNINNNQQLDEYLSDQFQTIKKQQKFQNYNNTVNNNDGKGHKESERTKQLGHNNNHQDLEINFDDNININNNNQFLSSQQYLQSKGNIDDTVKQLMSQMESIEASQISKITQFQQDKNIEMILKNMALENSQFNKRLNKQQSESFFDRQIKFKTQNQEKIKKEKEKLEQQEKSQLKNFKANKNSVKMINSTNYIPILERKDKNYKASEQTETKLNKIMFDKKLKEEQELSQCTFRPNTQRNNNNRNQNKDQSFEKRSIQDFYQQQQSWVQQTQEKIMENRIQNELQQMEGVTYRPNINKKKGQNLKTENDEDCDVVDRLYKKQQEVIQKKIQYEQNFYSQNTFQPIINMRSSALAEKKRQKNLQSEEKEILLPNDIFWNESTLNFSRNNNNNNSTNYQTQGNFNNNYNNSGNKMYQN